MASTNVRFVMLGKSKFVHAARTKAQDLGKKSGSECQMVRKAQVANTVPKKGMSPEAASALDPCPHCPVTINIKAARKAARTKDDTRADREEVQAKFREEAKTDGQRRKDAKKAAKVKAAPKPKKERVAKEAKPTKSGPRSVGGSTDDKAAALAAFATEHGWDASVDGADPGLMVTAARDGEIIRCFFVDGKYDTTRHASLEVGTWTGKLRGVHGCRKQMSMEGRDKPHPEPGKGRGGPRRKAAADEDDVPEDESPEDAVRRVPFAVDAEPSEVIERIKGKTIRWRNGVSNGMEEAWLPSDPKGNKRDKITITEHPKTGRRMVSFLTVAGVTEHGEQYGPERSVYLDKIVRVV